MSSNLTEEINKSSDEAHQIFNHLVKLISGTSFLIKFSFLLFVSILTSLNTLGQSRTYTTSDSFTVPAGVTSVTVQCWGAGGGGGNRSTNGGAGGGGGGAFASSVLTGLTPGVSYTITVGTGASAANGGNSSFGVLVVAAGGSGVTTINTTTGAAGGTYDNSTGETRFPGGNGGNGTTGVGSYSGGGGGGAGTTGAGGNASGQTAGAGTSLSGGNGGAGRTTNGGNPGSTYGGGGGGAYRTSGTRNGGAGANGAVIVTWTQPVFYYQGSGNITDPANWRTTRTGGGGYTPDNFTDYYQTFVVQSGQSVTTNAAWAVTGTGSIIQIENGATLTETFNITLDATGTIQVDNGGTLNHNVNSTSIFTGTESFGSTSTIVYGFTSGQTIASATYGNLTESNGGTNTLAGTSTVNGTFALTGTLSITANYTLTLNSTVNCGGTVNATNGTIIYPAATSNIISGTYYNLTLAGGSYTYTQCGAVTVSNNLTTTNTGATLSTAYDLNIPLTVTNPANLTLNASAGTVTYSRNGVQNVLGGTYNNLTTSGNNTKTVSAAITVNGTITTGAATILAMTTNILSLGGSATITNNGTISTTVPTATSSTPIPAGRTWGGTITYAAAAGSQTVVSGTYNNLTLSNTSGTNTAGGTISVTGVYTSTNGGTFSTAYDLTFNGTTPACPSGTIISTAITTFSSTALNVPAGTYSTLVLSGTGTYTFCGATTINTSLLASGTLNLSGNLLFGFSPTCGPIINATGGTVTYPAATSNILAGTYYGLTFTGGTYTYTQCGAISISNSFNITNTGATLNTAGYDITFNNGTFTNPTYCTISATTGTATYGFAGAQSIIPGTYYDLLTLSSGTKTLAAAITVNNNLQISGTSIVYTAGRVLTGNANGTLTIDAGAGLQLGSTSSTTPISMPVFATYSFATTSTVTYQSNNDQAVSSSPVYGNLVLSTTAPANKTASGPLSINGNLTINANTTLMASGAVGVTGNATVTGTFNLGTTAAISTIGGTAAIAGSVLFNTTGIKTLSIGGNLSGAGTIDMSGLAHTLNLAGATNTIGTLTTTASGSTVNYNGTTNQTVYTSNNYRNLTISGSGTKTMQGNFTLNENLYITGTATFATGTNTLTGSSGTLTMDGGSTFTLGTTGSATSVPWPTFTGGYFLNTNSTVVYQANTNTQTITTTPTYGNLTILTGATTLTKTTSAGDLNVNGNLTLTNGTGTITLGFENTVPRINTVTGNLLGNGTLNMTTSHTLNIGGDNLHTGTFTRATGTVNYNGTNKTQLIRGGITYYNLTVSGGGTKYLGSATTVDAAGTLSLGGAVLQLGDYNLTLLNTGTSPISGSPSSSNMIETNGSGMLVKTGTASPGSTGLNITYPIGAGGYYSPMTLSAFTATGGGTTVSVRSEFLNQGSSTLKKRWYVESTYTGINATSLFNYNNPQEVCGNQSLYTPWYSTDGGSTWTAPASPTGAGVNPFGGTNALVGQWTAGETTPSAVGPNTYYSYQSGNFDRATTWTTDPSGTLWIGGFVPGSGDNVVILNGRTVTATSNTITINSLEIREGGILDLGSRTGHNFGTVRGQGTLRLNSMSFPSGTFTEFVASAGGTVEYYNIGGNLSTSQLTYNNLKISNSSALNNIITIANASDLNYIVNGYLSIGKSSTGTSTLTLGSQATNIITIDIHGDVTVDEECSFLVGAFNALHQVNVYGDFTNNGTVNFNRNTYYTTNTNGAAVLTFWGSTNNTLTVNTNTRFYNFRVNKGTDQTYILTIVGTVPNCDPFGGNDEMINSDQAGEYATISIYSGTVKLGENITVAQLSAQEGYDIGVDVNQEKAQLWIDGATVSEPGFIAIYGKLKISSGTLTTNRIVIRYNGSIEVNGGTITVAQIRPSIYTNSTPRGSYIQTGGVVDVTGPANNTDYPIFCWPHASTAFIMSDGIINVRNCTTAGWASTGGITFLSDNYEITGGTVNVYASPSNVNFNINSKIPFWNLNIYAQTTGNKTITTTTQPNDIPNSPTTYLPDPLPAQPLVVLNDLTIYSANNPILSSLGQNLTVGGNFTVQSGTSYIPGANTTYFNGTGSQTFDKQGTCTLNHLVLSGTSSLTLNNAVATIPIVVNGNFSIGSGCTLIDNGRILELNGSTGTTISNSGTHYKATGAGSIRLTGTTGQTITGDGNGSFNNLVLYKTGGSVTMTSDMTITGNLRLAGTSTGAWNRLSIGSNKLALGATSSVYSDLNGTSTTFDNSRMILTSGYSSDEGVSKTYSSTNAFTFPFGLYTNSTYYYLPAIIQFSIAPDTYGTVTTRPVGSRHYLAQSTNSLSCYWHTTSSGFSGIDDETVRYTYYYKQYFADGNGTETDYYPGVYSNGSWTYFNDVNNVDDGGDFFFNYTANTADGDHTAGELPTFGTVTKLYSVNDGDWDNASTWSTTQGGTAGDGGYPGSQTLVYILDNHDVYTDAATALAGGLYIEEGSSLDLRTYQGHNFAALPTSGVNGNGTLRIGSSDYFPQGDFGNFIGPTGGTVEYYTNATNNSIIVPVTSVGTGLPLTSYFNLILNTSSGTTHTITLPLTNVTVYGDLEVQGNGTTSNTGVGTPATGYTYTIEGNLNVLSGILEFRNNVVHTFNIMGNTSITSGAAFGVRNTASANNVLNLYGSLTNNGTFDMNNTGRTHTYFLGTNDETISGSGTPFDFYDLTVDKGTDTTAVLTLQSAITTGFTNPFLTLSNGTFRVDGPTVTVSTTSPFDIPSTACFSVKSGSATIGTTNDAGDVNLIGKLEVLGGTLNIGSTTGYNNDIEYAASGFPTINISGGTLNVYGQIRRATTTTNGSLIYNQSGGSVIILGQNQEDTRAKLEITNTGSEFNMSGGTITIREDEGTTYHDLYIRPETYNITGGTIYLGDASTTAGNTFNFVADVPLWNLEIGNAAATQTANVNILPLTVQNLLGINGNSIFNAGGFDVTIKGSLTNGNSDAGTGTATGGYRAGSSTQITTFNGSAAQNITGTSGNITNFANVVISNTGSTVSLNANSNIRINGNLAINSGTLADGSNTITLTGDVENNATHTSNSTTGGIIFEGTLKQYISGSGSGVFGNITLNNSSGIDMKDNSVINGRITFSQGILYIDDYLLTMGVNASIGGTCDESNMIMINGVLSDQGVKKIFASGDTDPFTFPIGVSGQYTPATYDFSSNGNSDASITVKPINDLHKSVLVPPANYLNYYWGVITAGFSNSFSVNFQFNYTDDIVVGSELSYIAQRYDVVGNEWYRPLYGSVTSGSNYFSFTNVTDSLTGEFTAAEAFNAQPVLYSIVANGDWGTVGTWSESEGGSSCGYTPNGNPVVISSGHTITLASDGADAYSTNIIGTLNASNTSLHDLGHVDGDGRLVLVSTYDEMFVCPGGEYDAFMANTNSIIEFSGTYNGTLPLKPGNYYKPYNNVEFSGTGIKYMSAENLKINGDMTFKTGARLNNTLYNKNLYLLGDWTDENTTISGFVPGTGMVTFMGTVQQAFSKGAGADETFYNLTINNSSGVSMSTSSDDLVVSKYLYLTSGNILTTSSAMVKISNTSTSAIIGGSSSSFVDGPLSKNIISGQSFLFPVGDGTRFGAMTLLSTSVSPSPKYWTVQHYNVDPHTVYTTATYVSPLSGISDNEYWVVSRPTGGKARIRLRWDSEYSEYTSTSALRSMLRVVEYEDGANTWTERSNSSGVSGNATSGTITTTSTVTADDYIFTIGVGGVTAAISNTTAVSICNDGTSIASVPVTLTGAANWKLYYKAVKGATTIVFDEATATSSNYTIQLRSTDLGGVGTYTVSLDSVRDGNSIKGICSPATKDITVNAAYTPVILVDGGTSYTVGAGETHSYSTVNHSGSTYSWTWSGAAPASYSPGLPSSSNPLSLTINSLGSFNLQVTETYGTCPVTVEQTIEVSDVPAPNIDTVTNNVCQGEIIRYSVVENAGHTYLWEITGGTAPSYTDYYIDVTWGVAGSGEVKITETNSGLTGEDSFTLTIYNAINTTYTPAATESPICYDESTSITMASSQSSVTYQLRNATTHDPVGGTQPGGGALSFATGNLTATTTFEIYAYNSGCFEILPTTVEVVVNPLPTISAALNAADDSICDGDNAQYELTFTSSAATYTIFIFEDGTEIDQLDETEATSSPYIYNLAPVWGGLLAGKVYQYTTQIVDGNTCSSSITTPVEVTVFKIPETGPEYHIPNTFGL